MKGIDEPEWEIEIAFYVNQKGIDPEQARIVTILRWMSLGYFEPLAAAIWQGGNLDDAILGYLATMIDEGQLKLAGRGRGRPKSPVAQIRNIVVGIAHENGIGTIEQLSEIFGASEQSVKQAVARWHRWRKTQDK